MPQIAEVMESVAQLDPAERDGLIRALAERYPQPLGGGAFPSVVRTPDVCGGDARLVRTRIPVWTLESLRRLGATEAELLRDYPSLDATDLLQAWAYAAAHAEEIDRAIRENEEA